MASSIDKKVKLRVARYIDQLTDLRTACRTPADSAYIERCIELSRHLQHDIADIGAPQRQQPAPRQPAPARPAPAPQPAAAQPRGPAQAQQASSAPFGDDDDDLPEDHPWRGQPDNAPAGWTPPAQQPRGHWASATELHRGEPSSYIADDAGSATTQPAATADASDGAAF